VTAGIFFLEIRQDSDFDGENVQRSNFAVVASLEERVGTGMMMFGMMELLIILVILGTLAGVIALVVFMAMRSSGGSQTANPNLRPCPDCGVAVSIRASTCPKCGGPLAGGPVGKSSI
jgi:hypothetical protein